MAELKDSGRIALEYVSTMWRPNVNRGNERVGTQRTFKLSFFALSWEKQWDLQLAFRVIKRSLNT